MSSSKRGNVKNPVELPEKTPVNMPVNTPAFLPNDLDIGEGTILGNSYKVEKFLGQGVFGFVTKCINTQTNKAVAVKVNKNDPKILQQAKLEMFMLEQLQCLDPESCNIVRWNSIFFYFLDRERICLNFELLDQSLFDYTKDRNFQPLPISELSSMGIVHTDLKTDNLMIVDRRQSPIKVKIIDFGLACLVSSLTPDVTVQPIFYRAPEVMLNAPFNEAIDMWSLGLIAAELAIGRPLYPGKMEIDVFRFITLTQGQPPDHWVLADPATLLFTTISEHGTARACHGLARAGCEGPIITACGFNLFLFFLRPAFYWHKFLSDTI
uniref:Protein kinase domain-containing protein n=1 Tax=Amphilophus citrinellus TaxID=61819 RepID=A0A3Q0QY29_AMPCI